LRRKKNAEDLAEREFRGYEVPESFSSEVEEQESVSDVSTAAQAKDEAEDEAKDVNTIVDKTDEDKIESVESNIEDKEFNTNDASMQGTNKRKFEEEEGSSSQSTKRFKQDSSDIVDDNTDIDIFDPFE
jgi:hypothetical protein